MKTATLAATYCALSLAALPTIATASDGQLEINATCAVQTGCFPGDLPGYPVSITQGGAYRLTSSLIQTEIRGFSSAENAIEIVADGVDLDLAGFSIRCTNPVIGACSSGSADGIFSVGGFRDDIRVANGRVHGMPGDGLDLGGGDGAVVENVRSTENGALGITTGVASRIERCTTVGNGSDGIFATGRSVITHNVSRDNGGNGISAISSVIVGNDVSENGGDGIIANSAVIRDNQVMSNVENGIRAQWQSKLTNNVVMQKGGFGLIVTNSAYEGNLLNGNTGGTVSGGVNIGGNSCNFAASCP